jgi:TonB family protein
MRHSPWLGILAILVPLVASAAVGVPAQLRQPTTLDQRELHAFAALTRTADFKNIRRVSSIPSCEDVKPPQALTTPDPLLGPSERGRRVKVSFLVGTDGRVHSPLILESAGMAGDHRVLQTIRTWRYRPATCNGVPAETEGNVEFSSR